MKRIFIIFFLLAFFVTGFSQTYKGKITEVVDGDTYFFKTGNETMKIRMFGVDAPEGNQPFGKESKEFISHYMNKDATIVIHSRDQFKRYLGTLFVDGQDINLLDVKSGYAWYFKKYMDDKQYGLAQEEAKRNKAGLWASSKPVAPWKWRHDERQRGINPHNKYN